MEPELVEKYVEDGTLRLEWRDFPYLGQESMDAAHAARAAGQQGKFWEYHDLLYENQGKSGAFAQNALSGYARELGLDTERFESDFGSEEVSAAVGKDFEAGQNAGISGTPTFEINGQRLVGFQSLETFEKVIEQEAGKAEGAS